MGACIAGTVAVAAAAPVGISKAPKATAKYQRLAVARKDGYGLLRDAAGTACIDDSGAGGMGVHYVKSSLVGDGKVDLLKPEALVYDPQPNERRRLVAIEYVVFQAAWDASHSALPRLYGRRFALVEAGNRYGLDPFYELHAWLWKEDLRGMFGDWNPRVTC